MLFYVKEGDSGIDLYILKDMVILVKLVVVVFIGIVLEILFGYEM